MEDEMKVSGWMALAATAVMGQAQAAQAQDGCERCRGKKVVGHHEDRWDRERDMPDFMMFRHRWGGQPDWFRWERQAPGPEARRFIERVPERGERHIIERRFDHGPQREWFEHRGPERDHFEHRGMPPQFIEKRIERDAPPPDRGEREERFEKRIERAPERGERFEKRIERDMPPRPAERIERDVIKRAPPEHGDMGGALEKISRILDKLEERLSNLEKRVGDRR
jgi:hypothetical protein